VTVRTLDEFTASFAEALASDTLTTVVAKVEARGPATFLTDLTMLENRFQFQRYIRSIRGADAKERCHERPSRASVDALQAGRLRVVDLTQPLSAETPLLPLPPQWANSPAFRLRELSRYDERGPAWYWNAFETGEHTGTHFDAPVHWVSGKDLPDGSVDRIPPSKFIGPPA